MLGTLFAVSALAGFMESWHNRFKQEIEKNAKNQPGEPKTQNPNHPPHTAPTDGHHASFSDQDQRGESFAEAVAGAALKGVTRQAKVFLGEVGLGKAALLLDASKKTSGWRRGRSRGE